MKTLDEVIEVMQRAWGIEWMQMHDRVGAMRAALAAAEKEGWKLTPREATEEMANWPRAVIAWADLEPGVPESAKLAPPLAKAAWTAMHDASPSISKDTGGASR